MKAIKNISEKLNQAKPGPLAFLGGILVAILAAFLPGVLGAGTVAALLLVLGLIVGFLNVTQTEEMPFLVAVLALGLAAQVKFSVLPVVGAYLDNVMANIIMFVAPAAVIVSLKAIRKLGRG